MSSEISGQVSRYQQFVNDDLSYDLKIVEGRLREVQNQLRNWYQFKDSIINIRDCHAEGFDSVVHIGCNLYARATVDNVNTVYVDVGKGVYLAMTKEQAIHYSDFRIGLATKEAAHFQYKMHEIKAHMKMITLGLQELQKL